MTEKNLNAVLRPELTGINFDLTVFEEGSDTTTEIVSSETIFEKGEMLVPESEETLREYLQRQGCKDRRPEWNDVALAMENIWFEYGFKQPDGKQGKVYAAYLYYDEYPFKQEDYAHIVVEDGWEGSMRYEGERNDNILVDFHIPYKQDLLNTKIGDLVSQHRATIVTFADTILPALSKQQ